MRVIKLTKEQEQKWLEYLKNDRNEFLLRLLKKIKSQKNVKLRLGSSLLHEFVLYSENISESEDNEYVDYQDFFINVSDDSVLGEICKFLDFSNLKYHNLILNSCNKSFLKKFNIPIDLDQIYKKDLSYVEFNGFIFKGSFDNCIINNAIFKNNKDVNGNIIKINPKLVVEKNLTNCVFDDVEFSDNFDGCAIRGIDIKNCIHVLINPQNVQDKDFRDCLLDRVIFLGGFDDCILSNSKITNCVNTKVNPQTVKNKDLRNCEFNNVEFIGVFDDCNINYINLINCKNVKINPQKIKDKSLRGVVIEGGSFIDSINDCDISDVSLKNVSNIYVDADHFKLINNLFLDQNVNCSSLVIYIRNEKALNNLIYARRHLSVDESTVIVCDLKYQITLAQMDQFKCCQFKTIHSDMDDDLNEVFKFSVEEEQSNNVKKKSFFDRFKRK